CGWPSPNPSASSLAIESRDCNSRSERLSNEASVPPMADDPPWHAGAGRRGASAGLQGRLRQYRSDLPRSQYGQGSAGQAGTGVFQAREGTQRPGQYVEEPFRQIRARGPHVVRVPARATPEAAAGPGPRFPAQAPRIPGRPERAQERRTAAGARTRQPCGQAGRGGRKIRRGAPGSGVHQSQARHHRQGDQGAQRREIGTGPSVALRLGSIVDALGGELCGNPERKIEGLAALESASPVELSFLSNPRLEQQLAASRAACVIVAPAWREAALARGDCIIADQPYLYFARVTQLWKRHFGAAAGPAVHPSAVVDPDAVVDPSAR